MQWKIGICGKCGHLVRRTGPVDYGVCNLNHPPQDVELTFEFSEQDQRTIKNTLRRLRRQRKKLGMNPNNVPLSIDSVLKVTLLLGLQGLREMSADRFLEEVEK